MICSITSGSLIKTISRGTNYHPMNVIFLKDSVDVINFNKFHMLFNSFHFLTDIVGNTNIKSTHTEINDS